MQFDDFERNYNFFNKHFVFKKRIEIVIERKEPSQQVCLMLLLFAKLFFQKKIWKKLFVLAAFEASLKKINEKP